MRIPLIAPFIIGALLAGVPAYAQPAGPAQPQLGARTQSPDQMVGAMNRVSPEEEMRQLAAAADAHPLGTLENPIRVGAEGEHVYLGKLRCTDGTAPRIGARREAGIGAFGSVVGAYELGCGTDTRTIVFDMYQEEHVETRAPAGFTLRP
jgi:hypothetical protein